MIRKIKKIFRNLLTRYRYGNRFEGVIFTKRNENISRKGIVEIMDYTTIANAHLLAWNLTDTIKIGKFCSIASGVKILGGGNHKIHRVTSYPLKHVLLYNMTRRTDDSSVSQGPTIIGHDVWISLDAIILSGVTVGDGAVIGAGAVVTKEVPSFAIVAGNPAKIIGYRFSEKQINELLLIKWWDWDIQKIKDNINLFGDVDLFIKTFKIR